MYNQKLTTRNRVLAVAIAGIVATAFLMLGFTGSAQAATWSGSGHWHGGHSSGSSSGLFGNNNDLLLWLLLAGSLGNNGGYYGYPATYPYASPYTSVYPYGYGTAGSTIIL
jgi:hypothetical protein